MPAPSVPLIKIRPVAASGQLTFYWAAPASDGGSAITSYTLTCDGRSDEVIADPATRVYTVAGLTNGTSYTFSLYASNTDGAGPAATFRTVKPGAKASIVQDISANTLGENGAIIAWSAPANDGGASIGWYVVQSVSSNGADPVLKKSRRFYQTSCKLSGLNTASSYYFRVRAVNDPGYGPDASSNMISFGDPNIQYSDGTRTTVTGYTGSVSGTLNIPSGVTAIASAAFYGQSGMTSLVLPSTLLTIGSNAFRDCTGLTSLTLPNSITTINDEAFRGCTNLASVTLPTGSYNLIRYNTFRSCTGLLSVTIPGNIATVGVSAFFGCSGLTTLVIQEGVSLLDDEAFMNTTSLTSVTLPSTRPTIRASAFQGSAYTPPP